MSVLERITITRQCIDGQVVRITTGNIISAAFTHMTSRNLDPQLHTHNVTMNLTQRSDGEWRSVESKQWYDNARDLIGVVYQAELARLVKELGYEIEMTGARQDTFEIKGVPQAVIDAFSTRHQEMRAKAEELNVSGAKAMQKIALITRDKKQHITESALNKLWTEKTNTLDFSVAEVKQNTKLNVKNEMPSKQATDANRTVSERQTNFNTNLVKDAHLCVKKLASQEAVFSHKVLIADLIKLGMGNYSFDAVEKTIKSFIDNKTIIKSELNTKIKGNSLTDSYYTTPAALKKERYIISLMQQGQDTQKAVVSRESKINRYIQNIEKETGNLFKQGQKDAIKLITRSKDQVIGIQGKAGTGKTYMLQAAADLVEQTGMHVRGLCPTNSAAKVLEKDTGITSQTLASFLYEMDNASPEKIEAAKKQPEMWIVDEASLVNAQDMANLLTFMRQTHNRMVLVGDKLQLGAIEWGKPVYLMMTRGMKYAEMKEIIRQKNQALLQAVNEASQGRAAQALNHISHDIVAESNKEALIEKLAQDYLGLSKKDQEKTLVVIPDNKTRTEVMEKIRGGLIKNGQILGNELKADVLINANLSQVEKGCERFYQAGMVVEFGKDYKRIGEGVKRGDRYLIKSIDTYTQTVSLGHMTKHMELDAKKADFTWNPSKIAGKSKYGVDVYHKERINLSIGDKIIINKTIKNDGLKNGDKGKIIKIEDSKITLRFEDGSTKTLDVYHQRNFNYGYAVTVFVSQGMTYDRALVLAESWRKNLVNQRSFYVGLSRAKYQSKIYTNNAELLKGVLKERTGEKTSALEQMKSDQHAKAHAQRSQTKEYTDKQNIKVEKSQPNAKEIEYIAAR